MEKHIPQLLKNQRERSGLSQRAIAKSLGMSQSYLWQIETGKVVPSIRVATRLAREIGLNDDGIISVAIWAGEKTSVGPRDYGIPLNLMKRAKQSIIITGTVATGPLLTGRHILIEKLCSRCSVRVLLLDPSEKIFDRQERAQEPDHRQPVHHPLYESLITCNQLAYIWLRSKRTPLLEVRVHNRFVDFSSVLVDDRYAEFNPHQITGMVEHARENKPVTGSDYGQYVLSSADGDVLATLRSVVEEWWRNAQPLSLERLTNAMKKTHGNIKRCLDEIISLAVEVEE